MDSGTIGIILGIVSILITVIGFFNPVTRVSNWWAKTSMRRAERRVSTLEGDLAMARLFSESPQLLIVYLLQLLFIALGFSPAVIIGVVLTQTSASPPVRYISTAMGVGAFILIMLIVNIGTRLARRLIVFSKYEASTTALLAQLRAKFPQSAKLPQARTSRPRSGRNGNSGG